MVNGIFDIHSLGFTKQETILLSKMPYNQLRKFERINLITPMKVGGLSKPISVYNFRELLFLNYVQYIRSHDDIYSVFKLWDFIKSDDIKNPNLNLVGFDDFYMWYSNDSNELFDSIYKIFTNQYNSVDVVLIGGCILPTINNLIDKMITRLNDDDGKILTGSTLEKLTSLTQNIWL